MVLNSTTQWCSNWIIYNFIIYVGDEENENNDNNFDKTEQTVFKLLDLKDIANFSWLDRGYHVYLDSFYTSPKLILQL